MVPTNKNKKSLDHSNPELLKTISDLILLKFQIKSWRNLLNFSSTQQKANDQDGCREKKRKYRRGHVTGQARNSRAGPAHSPLAIENSTWLRKSASDEFSGKDTNQLSHNTPAGVP